MYISVIIPAYNEEHRLPVTLDKIVHYFASKSYTKELIIVNDCSTDKTSEVIKSYSDKYSYIREIKNIENNMLVNKGSVCVNGVSLTISNTFENSFEVCIIPYTFEHTNFNSLQIGDIVNIEFDILGKYFTKWMQMSGVKQQIND